MALIQCPECNKEISDKVKACPHCGFPFASKDAVLKSTNRIDSATINIKSVSENKLVVYVGIGIALMVVVGLLFVVVNTIKSQTRINQFNSDLQAKLLEDYGEDAETKILVDGAYAEQITYIEKEDFFEDFLNGAKDNADRQSRQSMVYGTYRLQCLGAFVYRQELISEYQNRDEYLKDETFKKVQELSHVCRMEIAENTFELSEDKYGVYVFLVNGEVVEMP